MEVERIAYRCKAGHEVDHYNVNYVTKVKECGHAHCNGVIISKIDILENGWKAYDRVQQNDVNGCEVTP